MNPVSPSPSTAHRRPHALLESCGTAARGLLALIPLLALASVARAELLVNGSFETPLVPVGSFTNFAGGSTVISGWTVVGIDSAVVSGTFTQSGIVFPAQSGNQFIDLAGVTSNSKTSGVTQTVPTTIGQAYQLRFQVGSVLGGGFFFPSTIDVSVNDGPRVSHTNPATPSNTLDWKEFTLSFIATTPTTKITFYNGGASNNYSSSLDSASLEAVTASVPALGAPGVATLLGALGFLAHWMYGRATRESRVPGSSPGSSTP